MFKHITTYVIIQICYGKSVGVKDNQMNFIFFIYNKKDCSKSIVQSISFHNELHIKDLVHEDGSRDKYLLEGVESIMTGEIELPENILLGKACQWNDNIWVVEDEPVVKVSEI